MNLKQGYKQTEIGIIPEDWNLQTIGEISKVDGGFAFSSKKFVDEGLYQVVKMSNLYKGVLDLFRSASFINNISELEKTYLLKKNDILLTLTGTTGKKDYGYSFRISDEDNLLLNQRLARIKCFDVDTGYILNQLKMSVFLDQFFNASKGGTGNQTNLSVNDILNFQIPIPPLPEQTAIATALSDIDALIGELDKLIAKKQGIKQATMQQLLTGKKRLAGFSCEWEVKRLGDIGESLIGLTYNPSDVTSDGILVLRSSNVFEGRLRFNDNVFVKSEVPERIMVRLGDILICVRNGSRDLIGKCAKIDESISGMTFGAFMAVFRTEFHNFLYHQFQSNVIKKQINEHLGATINQITNKSLNSFLVPIPPTIEEQIAIANILSDMDAEISQLEGRRAKMGELKQGMMQELLTGRIRLNTKDSTRC